MSFRGYPSPKQGYVQNILLAALSVFLPQLRQQIRLMLMDQRLDHWIEVALHNGIQAVQS